LNEAPKIGLIVMLDGTGQYPHTAKEILMSRKAVCGAIVIAILIVAAVSESRAQNQGAPQSMRWEYTYMGEPKGGGATIITPGKSFKGLNWSQLIGNYRGGMVGAGATSLDAMNVLGADGWEYVDYTPDAPDFRRTWIFKRLAK
jgi:hypothetical protein